MADWFDEQIAGVNQQGQQQGMPQVATAPDGVPVFGSGGKFFTRNPDGSMVEQFQGEKPAWLTQQAGGGQQQAGGGMPQPGSDVMQALTQFYQSQGKTPGGPGSGPTDIAYMAKRIQETGGMTPQNIQYWFGQGQYGQNGRIGGELAGTVPPESGGQGSIANPGNYKAPDPFTGQTDYTPQAITQPGAVNAQQITAQSVAQPGSITPQTVQGPQALQASTLANPQGFQGVSQEELQNDPQFQYAQQQAMEQLVNSGAAKGVARGSNEWKALQEQAANIAGQQYQQIYNNKFGEWNAQNANTLNFGNANNQNAAQAYGLTNQYQQSANQFNAGQNYNAQAQNIGNTMQTNQFNAGQNLQAQQANQGANLNAGQFNAGMNFNTQQANQGNQFAASQANNANRLNAYQTNANTALGAYGANVQAGLGYGNLALGQGNLALNQQGQNYNQGLSTFNANQGANQQAFNNNYSLAQLGLYANGQIGQQGSNYGAQVGNLMTGVGNAQAAGSQQQGQNWGGTLGNIGNYAGQLALYNQLQPQQQSSSSYPAGDPRQMFAGM